MSPPQAMMAGEIVEGALASKSLFPSQQVHGRSVIFPERFKAVHTCQVPDPVEFNSAIDYYIQFRNQSPRDVPALKTDRVLAQIMAHIIKESCYS